jgi:prepilin-type N-terminal cleavage/methylation domain-containing protein
MDGLNDGRRRRSARGFTLIEVMIALGILAVGLLSVAAAQLYAMRGGSSGRHTSSAAVVAHSQLENFQRIDFTDAALDATAGVFVAAPENPFDTVVQTPDGDAVEMTYTLSWRIADLDATRKAIDVRVTWDEPNRPGRQLVLSTVRHDDRPTVGS